jgi:SulP family sulfate permease
MNATWLERLLPAAHWWRQVGRGTLRADLAAGAVGAIVVLPQGIAFATLAGLPPQYGLYAAMVPAVVAALWGSWRSFGTDQRDLARRVATMALSRRRVPTYIELVLTLALLWPPAVRHGVARLGALVNFVSTRRVASPQAPGSS